MIDKNPVRLDSSIVEIDGERVDIDEFTFWSDTFLHTDILQYQDDDIKTMFTRCPETRTYEVTIKAPTLPDSISRFWETGERFALSVENSYFDFSVETAWIANLEDNHVTIVAKVGYKSFSHAC